MPEGLWDEGPDMLRDQMGASRQWQFGTHHAVWEDPDVIHVTFQGPMGFQDAVQLLAIYRELKEQGRFYMLGDIQRSSMDSATRKYMGSELRTEWFHGVVYVGANLLLRVISDALSDLVLFHNQKGKLDTRYAATVEEGRAVIAAMRRERQARRE